mmetsp:Transcript_10319/g.14240  ORF Transcript_10319/g.14240 Transcript_10319/m.14240 type:complete len:509 (+) Transcript_10319:102-1628(+)
MGRAGRTRPGICFRLWTTRRHKALEPRRKSELLRANLEGLCLQAAALDLPYTADELPSWQCALVEDEQQVECGVDFIVPEQQQRLGARVFLSRAVNPPEEKNIDRAMASLLDMGALHRNDETPSALGKALARLPLPPRLALAAYYARLLNGNNDDLLALPCLLETKDPYAKHGAAANKARAAAVVNCPYSDVAALVGAYAGFRRVRSGSAGFCRSNGLNYAALTLVQAAVTQLRNVFGSSKASSSDHFNAETSRFLIPALSAVALYPNITYRKPGDNGYSGRTGVKCRIHHSALANKKSSPYSSFVASKFKTTQFLSFGSLLEFVDSNGRSGLAVATVAPIEAIALLLLCHATIIRQNDGSLFMDNWLCIYASDKKVIDSLLILRHRLRLALAKLLPPVAGLDASLKDAIDTVHAILADCASDGMGNNNLNEEKSGDSSVFSGRKVLSFTPFASTQQQGAALFQSGSRGASGRNNGSRSSSRNTASPIKKNSATSNSASSNNNRRTSS